MLLTLKQINGTHFLPWIHGAKHFIYQIDFLAFIVIEQIQGHSFLVSFQGFSTLQLAAGLISTRTFTVTSFDEHLNAIVNNNP